MSDMGGAGRAPDSVRLEAIAWLVRLQASSDPRDDAAFEDWYAAYPDHAATYDAVLDNWERMEAMGAAPAASPALPQGGGLLRIPGLALLAAAVALVLLSLAGLYATGLFDRADPRTIASETGEIQTTQLSDGSRVTLDTDSAVQIAFSTGERRLMLLRGRARFAVSHDATRPFVVSTGVGEVIAHGTVFDVDRRGKATAVTLWQGVVEIKRLALEGKRQWLQPGQATIVEALPRVPNPTRAAADTARWPSGMLTFRDAPLGHVVRAANLYAVHPITLADRDVAALRFTGSFKASDTQALARILADTFALALSRDDRGNFVLKAPAERKNYQGK